MTKAQVKNFEDKVVTHAAIINDLKDDKQMLQKQFELVALRLPAPKVGFWSRIFGGGRKKEE